MKKILALLMGLFAITLVGCSGDDDTYVPKNSLQNDFFNGYEYVVDSRPTTARENVSYVVALESSFFDKDLTEQLYYFEKMFDYYVENVGLDDGDETYSHISIYEDDGKNVMFGVGDLVYDLDIDGTRLEQLSLDIPWGSSIPEKLMNGEPFIPTRELIKSGVPEEDPIRSNRKTDAEKSYEVIIDGETKNIYDLPQKEREKILKDRYGDYFGDDE